MEKELSPVPMKKKIKVLHVTKISSLSKLRKITLRIVSVNGMI